MKELLVFLDLETTGLDPLEDEILEVGLIAVDEQLEELVSDSWVVGVPVHRIKDGHVYMMHESSSLLKVVRHSAVPLDRVDRAVIDLLTPHLGYPRTKKIVLAGYSVHFDLGFIREHMPLLASLCSHNVLDVSAVRRFVSMVAPKDITPEVDAAHRALADCGAALNELRVYRHLLVPNSCV